MTAWENRPWWTEPCKYGHFDCSYRKGGPCGDQHFPSEETYDPPNPTELTMKHPDNLPDHLRRVHELTVDTLAAFRTLEEAHAADHQPHIGQTHGHPDRSNEKGTP